jgi:hypothetical protein
MVLTNSSCHPSPLVVHSLPRSLLSALQRLASSRQHIPRLSSNALPSTLSTPNPTTLCIWRIIRRLLIPRRMLQTRPAAITRRRRHRAPSIRTLERTSHRPQIQRRRSRLTRRRGRDCRAPCELRVCRRRLRELRWRRLHPCLGRDVRCCVSWLRRWRAVVGRGCSRGGCRAGAGLRRWRQRRVYGCCCRYVLRGACWWWVGAIVCLRRDAVGFDGRVFVGWNRWHGGLRSVEERVVGCVQYVVVVVVVGMLDARSVSWNSNDDVGKQGREGES